MDERAIRLKPLVCITDGKQHVRKLLREALSEFRFTIYECIEVGELSTALDARPPDLVVLGLTGGGVAADEMLRTLAAKNFEGKVPFCPARLGRLGNNSRARRAASHFAASAAPYAFHQRTPVPKRCRVTARRIAGRPGRHG